MKSKYWLITLSLLFCLFIYLFYRTTNTVVTNALVSVVSFETYEFVRVQIVSLFPLNYFTIYSLPEGLWVFSFTLSANSLYLPMRNRRFNLLFFPLIFSVGLEFLQLTPYNKGEFQLLDLATSIIFWLIAYIFCQNRQEKCSILNLTNSQTLLFLSIFSIVLLAHVWN